MKFPEFRRYNPPSVAHVYLFVCEDDFLIEEAKPIWARIFGGEWNFEKVGAKEFEAIDFGRLLEQALTPPLFGRRRAIIVTDAGGLSQARLKALAEIQQLPQSSLKVILAASNRRLVDSRSRTFSVVEVDPLKPGEVVRWLADRYQVAPDVARYLVESVGTDLYQLVTEMEKLKTYVGETRPIEARDVDVLILRSEQFGPFELDDALLARDYKKSVRVIGAMLDEGVEPLLVLSRLVRVWRQLFVGKALAGSKSAKDVASAASVPVWKADDFVTCCRKFEWGVVVKGFRELLDADRAFKTSTPNPEYYFEVLLWKLIESRTPQVPSHKPEA